MKCILFFLLIAFAFSPAVEVSRSQSTGRGQNTRVNLSGAWDDAGAPVIITDTGGSVTARYTNIKSCRHDDVVTPYSSGFTVSGSGNTLSGTGIICYYGPKKERVDPPRTPDPSPRGVQRTAVSIKVGANGYTLEGTQQGYHGIERFTLTRKCDAEKMCAALNRAYQYVGGVVATVNSGGRPNFSVAEFKENLSRQLSDIQRQLDSCNNPSNAIAEVGGLLSRMHSNASELQEIHLSLNGARTAFMQSGGPCSGRSTSGGTLPPGGDPPSGEDPPSGGENPPEESACKEGEEPKTVKDEASLFQLVRVIDQDISKLEQQARVTRGSRELAAVKARIVKVKKIRAFWQQARTVSCLPPNIIQLIDSYLDTKKARGEDTAEVCRALCTATAAWVAGLDGSPLQRLFTLDSCSAMCN